MIMKKEYLEDIKEYIQDIPETLCPDKRGIFQNPELMDALWTEYQKNVEYGCDEEWALDEAMEEVMKITVPRHHISITTESVRLKQYKKLRECIRETEDLIPSDDIELSEEEYELVEEIANMRNALDYFLKK